MIFKEIQANNRLNLIVIILFLWGGFPNIAEKELDRIMGNQQPSLFHQYLPTVNCSLLTVHGYISQAQTPVTADTIENLLVTGMEKGIKGDYQGAIATFSQVITLDRQAIEAYYNRGIAYARINRTRQAIQDFNTTIELNPNHAEAYWERGKLYLTLAQKEKAIQDLETASALFKQQGNEFAYRWVESQLADLKAKP